MFDNILSVVFSRFVFLALHIDNPGIFPPALKKNDEEKLFDGEDIEPSEENTPFLNNNDKETEEFLNYSNIIL